MPLFFYILIFIFGLAVGSFLNCVIYRLEIKKSFFWGRSFCPNCKHNLVWEDLIPVLSFLFLKGKCRYCGQKISFQYPLVELATAILFVLIADYTSFTNGYSFLDFIFIGYCLVSASFLIIIFVYDFKYYIIPDKVIFPAILVALIYNLFLLLFVPSSLPIILNNFYSAIGAGLFFLLLFLISHGKWMGFGDVKLTVFLGLFLGFPSIFVALFLSFCFGATIGIRLVILGKKTIKSELPFGPFLVAGTFIALLWGERIFNWYFNLF